MWYLFAALLLAQAPASKDLYSEAGAALAAGDLAKAESSLQRVTESDPRNARAWMLLAQTRARRHRPADALSAASKAEVLGKDDPQVLLGLVQLFTRLQPDLSRAAGLQARYAALPEAGGEAWRAAATLYLRAAQFDRAVEAAMRAPAEGSAEWQSILGEAYLGEHDWDRAAVHLEAAARLAPYDENSHFRLAQMFLLHGDFPHAQEVIDRARAVFDKSPQLELAAGVCAYGLRRFPEAVNHFVRTIDLAPDALQPYQFLARMLENAGDRLPEITERFRAYNERHPQDPAGYVLYAKALVSPLPPGTFPPEAGHALALLEKARELDATQAETHYQIGCLLERKREYAAAASELERSASIDPRQDGVHFHLARVYDRLGRTQDALRERELHQQMSVDATVPMTLGQN